MIHAIMINKNRLSSLMQTLTDNTLLGDLLSPLQRVLERIRPSRAQDRVEYQAAKQSGSYSKAADYFVKAVTHNEPMGIFYWALYYQKGLNPVTS